ncbi:hypothetical protein GCM10011578_094290 [Streptomyces fuscichromogenes]|uniref:Uncharacterized protein n=1 Tax=Streptomyces fuscichromogenes TaxID=1324013 RepID=A0A917XPJ4_9ACTN|nr:hypothetical protein GCM10011578_094290 [Streptomyces fuscichromogenes]
MILEWVETGSAAVRRRRLSGESEVVQARDTEHGVMDAVSFEAAVAQDLPALHTGEGVLDAGSGLLVGLVVFLTGSWQLRPVAVAGVGCSSAGRGYLEAERPLIRPLEFLAAAP